MERADEIFARLEIDADLAADRRINLRQQRGGHLDKVDAAQVRRGDKPREISDNSTAERNDERFAFEAVFGKLFVAALDYLHALGAFTGGNFDEQRFETGGG